MRLFAGLIVVLLSLAPALSASEIVVKSGEHGDFTRIVVTLPKASTSWSFLPKGANYVLKVNEPDPTFEISTVFDRIPRSRLTSLNPGSSPESLEFELGCECEAIANKYDGRFIVIDIKSIEKTEKKRLRLTAPLSLATANSSLRLPDQLQAAKQSQKDTLAADSLKQEVLSITPHLNTDRNQSLSQTALVEKIAKAASRGELQIALTTSSDTAPAVTLTERPKVKPSVAVEASSLTQIRVTNDAIQNGFSQDLQTLMPGEAIVCLDATLVDFSTWEIDTSFGQGIGNARRALFDEFDRPNIDAAKLLTKQYLHFSFGAEAHRLLQSLPSSRETDVLMDLARIMDGQSPRNQNLFENQSGCSGAAILWSLLSNSNQQLNDNDYQAVLLSVSAMPLHMRTYLGPKVANRLLDLGEIETAAQLLSLSSRGSEMPSAEHKLGEASILIAREEVKEAEEIIDEILETENEINPEVLATKMEIIENQKSRPDIETLDLASAFATEHRNTPQAMKTKETQIHAYLLAGDFEKAFLTIDESRSEQDPSFRDEFLSKAFVSLSENGDRLDFLALATRYEVTSEPLTKDALKRLASRFIDEGFSSEALKILGASSLHHVDDEIRLLRAKAALIERKPYLAAAELLSVEGEEANKLRALAFSATGNHGEAEILYEDLGDRGSATKEAWQAKNWASLENSTGTGFQAAVALAAQEPEQPQQGRATVLEQSRTLLQQSALARELLGQVRASIGTPGEDDSGRELDPL